MDRAEEELLLLRLTLEHLVSRSSWPTLADLHRRINRDLQESVEVGEVARRVAPHSLISGYHDLGDTFAPPLQVLARVPESNRLLDGVVAVIRFAHSKYMSSTDDHEVRVTEDEAREGAHVAPELAAVVRMALDGVPWITNGGGSNHEGWYFRVSDHITRWAGVESKEDLVDSLEAIAQHRREEYAAMARAKADMVRGSQSLQPVVVEQRPTSPHWYETSWARGLAWVLGIALTALTLFLGLRQI